MSDEDKANLRELAALAVRKASKEGSKIEKFIRNGLTEAGYEVIFHKKGLIANDRLEVFFSAARPAGAAAHREMHRSTSLGIGGYRT